MDRLIYTALSGASQTLYEQQISANNLANVNTNGFRADMAMATNDKVKGGGFDTRYMAQEGASGVNDSTGVAEKTERPLDVAIQGAGYIAVQDKNGNEVYTRNGNIQQDDQGNWSSTAIWCWGITGRSFCRRTPSPRLAATARCR